MFAYCNNNPICSTDSNGRYPLFVVDDVSTKATGTNEAGNHYYESTIHYSVYYNFAWGRIRVDSFSATVTFVVSSTGVAVVDNTQENAAMFANYALTAAFADEICKAICNQTGSPLENRTTHGIAIEIIGHYIASIVFSIGKKLPLIDNLYESAKEAHIGSNKKGSMSEDSNAFVFEFALPK